MSTPLEINPSIATKLVEDAQTFTLEQIEKLQQERLLILVDYARNHSLYYQKKYKDLPQNPKITDIPITLRSDAMEHFDDWTCDPKVTTRALDDYLSDIKNATEMFLGKYTVLTTSGTTGRPLRMVRDSRHLAVNGALMAKRLMGGSKFGNVTLAPDMKCAAVLSGSGYHSTYLSYLRMKKSYEKMGCSERFLPLFLNLSTAEMVEKLNEFQPEMLTGYPSNMKVLAMEQKKGKLHISPKVAGSSAEYLSAETREFIEEAFGCPMIDNYCSTEGGEIAMLCSHNRMHINTDWMILEPVDKSFNPVPIGEKSEGVLLTNLANLVQPVIRYFISDKIIINYEPCPCGLPFPSIVIEGRQEDNLTFLNGAGEEVTLPSSSFIDISMDVENCTQVQFIQKAKDAMEVRFTSTSQDVHAAVKQKLLQLSSKLLDKEGLLNVSLTISDLAPILGATGKLRNTMSLI